MNNPYTNRLIYEKSPYLLQHAHNPVDWYPWGEEAFLKAKDEDKPIFLSIGYSTCHWCHVMGKESFEDVETAKLLNQFFVCIKVDREELPEVDSLYMEFAQAIMPSGAGWPLNVVLTPELEPFFATTYVSKESLKGYIGFKDLLIRLKELWLNPDEKVKLIDQASKIVEVFDAQTIGQGIEIPLSSEIDNAVELLFHMQDPVWGGIRGEPKFPMGYHTIFLLNHAFLKSESRALFCAEMTLEMMSRGGIYDHLGGGFARYCLDSKWRTPHFEKMLYDNAILLRVYLEAYQYTSKFLYKEIALSILHFIDKTMKGSEGQFFSALDADSDGKEGYYYTWSFDEVKQLLPSPDFKIFSEFYNITKEGNFEGRNVIFIKNPLETFANKKSLDITFVKEVLNKSKDKLLQERNKRVSPSQDDKVLVSWNALMIYSLVLAAKVFQNDLYYRTARETLNFIKENLWEGDQLYRRFREGEKKYKAGLEEIAFLISALLHLFDYDGCIEDFLWAQKLSKILETNFKVEDGAFYMNDGSDPYLLIRKIEFYDGAEPSGNGIHAENLLKLYQYTFDDNYLLQAEDVFKVAKKHIEIHPAGCCYSLIALQRYWNKHASTLVIALNEKLELKKELQELLFTKFLPHHVVVWKYPTYELESIQDVIPHLKEMIPKDGKTTLYICQKGQCKGFIQTYETMKAAIDDLK